VRSMSARASTLCAGGDEGDDGGGRGVALSWALAVAAVSPNAAPAAPINVRAWNNQLVRIVTFLPLGCRLSRAQFLANDEPSLSADESYPTSDRQRRTSGARVVR
jgi:hypothetical protein